LTDSILPLLFISLILLQLNIYVTPVLAPEPSFVTEPSTTTSRTPARRPVISPSQSVTTSPAQDPESSEPNKPSSNGVSAKTAAAIQDYLSETLTSDGSLDSSGTSSRLAYQNLLERRSDWNLKDDELEITQTYILLVLFYATNGNDWIKTTGWIPSSDHPVCGNDQVPSWFGVTCDGERVTEVSLEDNNLVGTIPSELEGLRVLTNLTLSKNKIYGVIPFSIGKMTKLGM
jgi:hypothetical protein